MNGSSFGFSSSPAQPAGVGSGSFLTVDVSGVSSANDVSGSGDVTVLDFGGVSGSEVTVLVCAGGGSKVTVLVSEGSVAGLVVRGGGSNEEGGGSGGGPAGSVLGVNPPATAVAPNATAVIAVLIPAIVAAHRTRTLRRPRRITSSRSMVRSGSDSIVRSNMALISSSLIERPQ